MFKVSVTDGDYSAEIKNHREDMVTAVEVVWVCYQALVAVGYHPTNILDAFETVAEEGKCSFKE